MINFDQLPQESPNALPTPDLYRARIEEAKMLPSDGKPDYLNLKLKLTTKDGKSAGVVYDVIAESDTAVVQYKTARFIRAIGIPLTGSMELRDIAKLAQGKDIGVDINHSKENTYKGKTYPPKAQVDLFSREAYYTAAEFDSVYNALHPESAEIAPEFEVVDDADQPFNAPDGSATNGTSEPIEY